MSQRPRKMRATHHRVVLTGIHKDASGAQGKGKAGGIKLVHYAESQRDPQYVRQGRAGRGQPRQKG